MTGRDIPTERQEAFGELMTLVNDLRAKNARTVEIDPTPHRLERSTPSERQIRTSVERTERLMTEIMTERQALTSRATLQQNRGRLLGVGRNLVNRGLAIELKEGQIGRKFPNAELEALIRTYNDLVRTTDTGRRYDDDTDPYDAQREVDKELARRERNSDTTFSDEHQAADDELAEGLVEVDRSENASYRVVRLIQLGERAVDLGMAEALPDGRLGAIVNPESRVRKPYSMSAGFVSEWNELWDAQPKTTPPA